MRTYASPTGLPAEARAEIAAALGSCLADGLDLHSQIKVAHWNVKGPHFAALHPLFETFAVSLAVHNDTIAERAVTLGAVVQGGVRDTARTSTLTAYPEAVTSGLEHVRLLAERFQGYLGSLRRGREVAGRHGDTETSDMLTPVITEFEKHSWFLLAMLEE
jgi:starvation-inducible DNA-binding protein